MKRFFKIWGGFIAHAKENDGKNAGSGFEGLAPFLAMTLGWIPALYLSIFTKEPKE